MFSRLWIPRTLFYPSFLHLVALGLELRDVREKRKSKLADSRVELKSKHLARMTRLHDLIAHQRVRLRVHQRGPVTNSPVSR